MSYTSNTEEKATYTISPRRRPLYRRQGPPSFQGDVASWGYFSRVDFAASSRTKTRTSSLKEIRRSWTTRQRVSEAAHRTKIVADIIRIVLRFVGSSWRRADDGARRRCWQSWTVVHPARRRRASAQLRSLARMRVEGKSRVIPYQILVIVWWWIGEGREGRKQRYCFWRLLIKTAGPGR